MVQKLCGVVLVLALGACGGEEAVAVAPQAIAPGTPTSAVPGANVPAVGVPQGQPATAVASPNTGGPSNYGTVTLSAGFMPDPRTAQGVAGGSRNAHSLNSPGCRGYLATEPDHLFVATSNFTNLRIMVRAIEDTTLVIQKPDGSYVCDDDTEGRNPVVQAIFTPGTYKIFVGSYRASERPNYTIGFSELGSVVPSSLPAPALTPTTEPAATSEQIVTLSRGFMPDPKIVMGNTSGTVSANSMGASCIGYVPAAPNHTLVLQSDSPNLRIMARSTTDTMLAIRRPDGSIVCNDDASGQGFNPVIPGPFTAGTYQIYVGTFGLNSAAAYRLGFSELSSVDTNDI
ncbi:MAG: hypothetical protein ACI9KE_002874 [Polyangiales bacterium]|jgi:hypothetical protein